MKQEKEINVAVQCLLVAASERNYEERQHCRRVERFSAMTAESLGWTPEETESLRLAALLHHTDSNRLPEASLARGVAEILSEFQNRMADCPRMRQLPAGGRPTEGAAIIALADAYDRLVSPQLYRGALRHEVAMELLRYDAETEEQTTVFDAFSRAFRHREEAAAKEESLPLAA